MALTQQEQLLKVNIIYIKAVAQVCSKQTKQTKKLRSYEYILKILV